MKKKGGKWYKKFTNADTTHPTSNIFFFHLVFLTYSLSHHTHTVTSCPNPPFPFPTCPSACHATSSHPDHPCNQSHLPPWPYWSKNFGKEFRVWMSLIILFSELFVILNLLFQFISFFMLFLFFVFVFISLI